MQQLQYHAGTGEFRNWIVEEKGFDERFLGKCESILCQGNGYMGLRAALEEKYVGEKRDWFVNGVFDDFDGKEVTELANLPDVTAMPFWVDGERFHLDSGTVRSAVRRLNLRTGELSRDVEWTSPSGAEIRLRSRRFVSLTRRHILGQRLELTALSGPMTIELESGIDARQQNTGTQHFSEGAKRLRDGRILQSVQSTVRSEIQTAVHTVHTLKMDGRDAGVKPLPAIRRRQILQSFRVRVQKGQTLTLEKISSVCTSRDAGEQGTPEERGDQGLRESAALGYEGLQAESAARWSRFWDEQGFWLEGPDFDQLALRFAQYHLRICYGSGDSRLGIGAKAMSGEGYKGHSFWDTEMFLLPYFIVTRPQDARRLLEYRYRGRDAARRKAKENGCEGMMFPWEAAWPDDGETTPLWGAADIHTGAPLKIWTGLIEQHITADIAYAVDLYARFTGDEEFMERCGYELLLGTAWFWASRAEWNPSKQRYELRDVIGPDEYKEHANNNAYTNYLACHNLDLAISAAERLSKEKPDVSARLSRIFPMPELLERLKRVRARFYLPQPTEDGVLPQDDAYLTLKQIDLSPYRQAKTVGTIYNHYNMDEINVLQVTKQADVVLLFNLLPGLFDRDVQRSSYRFYERRTLHDSSLSFAMHSLSAARLGLSKDACALFRKACLVDLGPNPRSSDAGIHAASMGGIWQDAVFGFCGVGLCGDRLEISPRLPASWQRVRLSLFYRGCRLRLTVERNALEVTNLSGQPLSLRGFGQEKEISAGKTAVFAAPDTDGRKARV